MRFDLTQWNPKHPVVVPGHRAYNALVEVPRRMKELFPELNDFELGFFVEDDLPGRLGAGWVRIHRIEHLGDDKEACANITARAGCYFDDDGYVRQGRNFVCVMPNEHRRRIKIEEKRLNDDNFQKVIGANEENMSSAHGNKVESTVEQAQVELKRGPGRPRKEA